MNLFYVFDEYTDIADGNGTEKIRAIVMDALRNPHTERPEGEHLIGAMTREYVKSSSKLLVSHRALVSGFALLAMFLRMHIVYPTSFATSIPTQVQ